MPIMNCPRCNAATKIEETRAGTDGEVRRYRRCTRCDRRFATIEQLDLGSIQVVKGDPQASPPSEQFDRLKLRKSIRKASVRRVPNPELDDIVDRVVDEMFANRSPDTESSKVNGREIGRTLLAVLEDDRRHAVLRLRYALMFGPSDNQFSNAEGFVKRFWKAKKAPTPDRKPQRIAKRDGTVEPFNDKKLTDSIAKAITRRHPDPAQRGSDPVAKEVAEKVMDSLAFQPLVTAAQVATEVLRILNPRSGVQLEQLKPGERELAYLRVASTAKGFQSEDDFLDEAAGLIAARPSASGRGRR